MANIEIETTLWKQEASRCVGVDEVGRGCLAGPVVSAAVMLPLELVSENDKNLEWFEINDSKTLTEKKRLKLSQFILERAQVQIAWAYPKEIDQFNILQASMLSMRRALRAFRNQNFVLLVDGNQNPYQTSLMKAEVLDTLASQKSFGNLGLDFKRVETIVKGDQKSISIAAASVVAKVYRDQWMSELGRSFPQYQFSKHKGYSTPTHIEALNVHGPTPIHRFSFEPVRLAQKDLSVSQR